MSPPAGRVPLLAAIILFATLAGCTSGGSDVNPNLLLPKMVVDASVNGTPLVYVHSAFGERAYDVLRVRVDNETELTNEYAYSLETKLEAPAFFLEVEARSGESRFRFAGSLALDIPNASVRVIALDEEGKWTEPNKENLPYERIIPRLGEDRPE